VVAALREHNRAAAGFQSRDDIVDDSVLRASSLAKAAYTDGIDGRPPRVISAGG